MMSLGHKVARLNKTCYDHTIEVCHDIVKDKMKSPDTTIGLCHRVVKVIKENRG